MSLKHLKFEDSFTMRSLEKLAISKGMIKPDAVVKNASQSQLGQDLEPTKDLVQNILKLCDGLRASGFEKQADALEFKFVQFKKEANELYNTSKEVGEDLVDAAHPKGSYKLEGVAGDATVETIIDQKKKIQDIVNKKPTGKLANNKDIIKAVKLSLGIVTELVEAAPKSPAFYTRIFQALSSAPGTIAGAIPNFTAALSAPVGGTGATGAAATSVGVAGTAVIAIPLAVIGGGLLGSKLFDNAFYAIGLKEAYDKCISESDDVLKLISGKQAIDLKRLKENFAEAMDLSAKMSANAKEPKIGDVIMMKSYVDRLQNAMDAAASLMSWARGKRTNTENIKPGTSVSDDGIWSKLKAVIPVTDASDLQDLELTAGNFINVASKAKFETQDTINSVISAVQEKANAEVKQQVAVKGGDSAVNLDKNYNDILANIGRWRGKIKAKRLENASTLNIWLSTVENAIKEEQKEFASNKDKSFVAKDYQDRLSKVLPKIKAFEDKWINS